MNERLIYLIATTAGAVILFCLLNYMLCDMPGAADCSINPGTTPRLTLAIISGWIALQSLFGKVKL